MRIRMLLIGVLAVTGLCGCLKTYRMEQRQTVNAAVCSDGSVSCCSESQGEARQWCGPGLCPAGGCKR